MQERKKAQISDKDSERLETEVQRELATEQQESTQTPTTARGLERQHEDDEYVPVIVKRSDQALRHPDDILEKAIEEGIEQIERPFLSLALSSLTAGLLLGFTAMAVAIMTTLVAPFENELLTRLATALVYPLGFIICIKSGTQLFTEHTATAVYPVLDGKASGKDLLRLWAVVIVGNVAGAALSAWLFSLAEDVVLAREGYVAIGQHLVEPTTLTLLISSLLAGWLMALGGWLILASPPTLSQIVCIYIVTFLIGLGGLHHSIAGSVEMFSALFMSDAFTYAQGFRFIGLALLGNMLGGSLFVAILNYSHIRQTQQITE